MNEKFVGKGTKKSNFFKQMQFRKKSNLELDLLVFLQRPNFIMSGIARKCQVFDLRVRVLQWHREVWNLTFQNENNFEKRNEFHMVILDAEQGKDACF